MEYLYIMDYSDCTISRMDATNIIEDNIEQILSDNGFDIDTCVYMFSEKYITITEINV